MASQAKYARRRRNAFLAAIALALLFIIVVILIIVGISKRGGGNSGDGNVPTVTTAPGVLPTPDGLPDTTPSDDPDPSASNSPSPSSSTAAGTRMYITGDGVNVRKEASTSSEKLTTLAKGTAVTAYELSGDFYQVKLSSGDIGYVSKNYLSTTNPANDPSPSASPTATPNTSNGKTMYVTGDSVNVRSTPSSSGSKLTSLKKGAQVTAYENKNGWYYIQYQSNKFGYISASYLTADAPSTATPTPTPTPTPTKPPTPSSWLDIGLPQEVIANFGTSVSTQAAYLGQTKVGQTVSAQTINAYTYYRIEKNDGSAYYIAIEAGNENAKAYIYTSLDHIPGSPVT